MANLNVVIRFAKNEVGYLEKKSNSDLDHPAKNAGKNNYTKYNRDYMAWGKKGLIEIPRLHQYAVVRGVRLMALCHDIRPEGGGCTALRRLHSHRQRRRMTMERICVPWILIFNRR